MFEYSSITIRVTGARQGILSPFLKKGLNEECFAKLQKLGREGWEIVGLIPIVHGAVNAVSTDAAIAILKRGKASTELDSRKDANQNKENNEPINVISGRYFDCLVARKKLKTENRDQLTDFEFNMASQMEFPEAIPAIEMLFEKYAINGEAETIEKIENFYRNLSKTDSTKSLYNLARNQRCFDLALKIATNLNLFEADLLQQYLMSETNIKTKNNYIQFFWVIKDSYTYSDCEGYINLKESVIKAFQLSPINEGKNFFGKPRRYWSCLVCKAENDAPDEVGNVQCTNCFSDRHGIINSTREIVIEMLDRRITTLQTAFE